jgi:hypothetical protein
MLISKSDLKLLTDYLTAEDTKFSFPPTEDSEHVTILLHGETPPTDGIPDMWITFYEDHFSAYTEADGLYASVDYRISDTEPADDPAFLAVLFLSE